MTLGTFVFVLKNLLLNIQPQYDCFGISKSLEDLCDFTCEPIEVLLVIAKLEKLGFQRMLNAPLQVHNDIFACPCIHNQLPWISFESNKSSQLPNSNNVVKALYVQNYCPLHVL